MKRGEAVLAFALFGACDPYGANEVGTPVPDRDAMAGDANADTGGEEDSGDGGDASAESDAGAADGGDAGDGGDGGPPTVPSCPAGALLCEDFETNTFDPLRWNESYVALNSTMGIVADTSGFGQYSMRVTTGNSGGDKYALRRAKLGTALGSGSTFALRVWLRLAQTQPFDTGILKLRQRTSSSEDMTLRFADQNRLKVDTDTSASGADIASTTTLPTNKWFCLEWVVTLATSGRHRLYFDGTEILDAAENTVGTLAGGAYDEVEVGFSYVSSGNALEVRYDNLVLGTTRIGCY